MSQFLIYIPLPSYLDQWLTCRLGNPVRFPQYSNENAVIRTFIKRLPRGEQPQLPGPGLTAIAIPASTAKPPRTYNHMGERGRRAVTEAIKDLFMRSLWSDITPLSRSDSGLNSLIAAWCETNGIDEDHVETVRQCYYRLRRRYSSSGINIKKNMKI